MIVRSRRGLILRDDVLLAARVDQDDAAVARRWHEAAAALGVEHVDFAIRGDGDPRGKTTEERWAGASNRGDDGLRPGLRVDPDHRTRTKGTGQLIEHVQGAAGRGRDRDELPEVSV